MIRLGITMTNVSHNSTLSIVVFFLISFIIYLRHRWVLGHTLNAASAFISLTNYTAAGTKPKRLST